MSEYGRKWEIVRNRIEAVRQQAITVGRQLNKDNLTPDLIRRASEQLAGLATQLEQREKEIREIPDNDAV